jgi:hypothetical protein
MGRRRDMPCPGAAPTSMVMPAAQHPQRSPTTLSGEWGSPVVMLEAGTVSRRLACVVLDVQGTCRSGWRPSHNSSSVQRSTITLPADQWSLTSHTWVIVHRPAAGTHTRGQPGACTHVGGWHTCPARCGQAECSDPWPSLVVDASLPSRIGGRRTDVRSHLRTLCPYTPAPPPMHIRFSACQINRAKQTCQRLIWMHLR